jgi:hydroxylamine dehydrogenase
MRQPPVRRFILAAAGLFCALLIDANFVHAADPAAPDAGKATINAAASDRAPEPSRQLPLTFPSLSKESATCASCHAKESPGVYQQWGSSKHYGGNVGCYECHKAKEGDPGAIKHKDFLINVLVTPKVCSTCHAREAAEMDKSYHSTAGQILGSLDNTLAEVVEGSIHAPIALNGESPVAVQGCWQCHGSPVKVLANGKLDPATWPNSGIGRMNPDGSKGACNACHQRHAFSAAQARQPETCGKCHLGPDHPQKEIYDESKHGIAYRTNIDKMNLSSPKWIPGQDYSAAPTCATCHMSATNELPVTHDVGSRITWNLRLPISPRIDAKNLAEGKPVKLWQDRQKDMKQVCTACHEKDWVENWYVQYDSVVNTYNEKFAKPGAAIMKALNDNGLITTVDFDTKIKWTWYYLWHHEGRRARHGAAMQGPDYVQWHGFFEVAGRFYTDLIPEAREIAKKAREEGKAEQAAAVEKVIDDILKRPEHQWILGKNPPYKAEHDKARVEFMKQFNTNQNK